MIGILINVLNKRMLSHMGWNSSIKIQCESCTYSTSNSAITPVHNVFSDKFNPPKISLKSKKLR